MAILSKDRNSFSKEINESLEEKISEDNNDGVDCEDIPLGNESIESKYIKFCMKGYSDITRKLEEIEEIRDLLGDDINKDIAHIKKLKTGLLSLPMDKSSNDRNRANFLALKLCRETKLFQKELRAWNEFTDNLRIKYNRKKENEQFDNIIDQFIIDSINRINYFFETFDSYVENYFTLRSLVKKER
jgi:hypothetical protein